MWLAGYWQSTSFCVFMNLDKESLSITYTANGKRQIHVENFSK